MIADAEPMPHKPVMSEETRDFFRMNGKIGGQLAMSRTSQLEKEQHMLYMRFLLDRKRFGWDVAMEKARAKNTIERIRWLEKRLADAGVTKE